MNYSRLDKNTRRYQVAIKFKLSKQSFRNIKESMGESELGYMVRGGFYEDAKKFLRGKYV